MPESAAGTTTLSATWYWAAPSAWAPSLSDWGTALMASSLRDATMGISMTPMARAAPSAVKIVSESKMGRIMFGLMNDMAKNP